MIKEHLWNTDPPMGYGITDQDETPDEKDCCDVCGKEADEDGLLACDCYSPCCGARIYPDSDICPDCKEHFI